MSNQSSNKTITSYSLQDEIKMAKELQKKNSLIILFDKLGSKENLGTDYLHKCIKLTIKDIVSSVLKIEKTLISLGGNREYVFYETTFMLNNSLIKIKKINPKLKKELRSFMQENILFLRENKLLKIATICLYYLTVKYSLNENVKELFEADKLNSKKSKTKLTHLCKKIINEIKDDAEFFKNNAYLYSNGSILEFSTHELIPLQSITKKENEYLKIKKIQIENGLSKNKILLSIVLENIKAVEEILKIVNLKKISLVYSNIFYNPFFELENKIEDRIHCSTNFSLNFFYQLAERYTENFEQLFITMEKKGILFNFNRDEFYKIIEIYFALKFSDFDKNIYHYMLNKITLMELKERTKLLHNKSIIRTIMKDYGDYEKLDYFGFDENSFCKMIQIYFCADSFFSKENYLDKEVIEKIKKLKVSNKNSYFLKIILSEKKLEPKDVKFFLLYFLKQQEIALVEALLERYLKCRYFLEKVVNKILYKEKDESVRFLLINNRYSEKKEKVDEKIYKYKFLEILDQINNATRQNTLLSIQIIIDGLKIINHEFVNGIVQIIATTSEIGNTDAENKIAIYILREIARKGEIKEENKLFKLFEKKIYSKKCNFWKHLIFENHSVSSKCLQYASLKYIQQSKISNSSFDKTNLLLFIPSLSNIDDYHVCTNITILYRCIKEEKMNLFSKIIRIVFDDFKKNSLYCIGDGNISLSNKIKTICEILDKELKKELSIFFLQEKQLYRYVGYISNYQTAKILDNAFEKNEMGKLVHSALSHSNVEKLLESIYILNIEKKFQNEILSLDEVLRSSFMFEMRKHVLYKRQIILLFNKLLSEDFLVTNIVLKDILVKLCDIFLHSIQNFKSDYLSERALSFKEVQNIIISKKRIILAIISEQASLENDKEAQRMIKSNIIEPLHETLESYANDYFLDNTQGVLKLKIKEIK